MSSIRPLSNVLSNSCKWPPPARPLLVVIPASSDPTRLRFVRNNLYLLPSREYACVVITFAALNVNERSRAELQPILDRCSVCLLKNSSLTEVEKRGAPRALVKAQHTAGVLLLLDDVSLNFSVGNFVRTARRLNLDTASPAILNSWRVMGPHRHTHGAIGRSVRVIEAQAQWFSQQMWTSCYWDLLDPAVNGGGYGIDTWEHDWCARRMGRAPRMGILDCFVGVHHGGARRHPNITLPHPRGSLYQNETTRMQQSRNQFDAWRKAGRGELTTAQSVFNDTFFGKLFDRRNGTVIRCKANGTL